MIQPFSIPDDVKPIGRGMEDVLVSIADALNQLIDRANRPRIGGDGRTILVTTSGGTTTISARVAPSAQPEFVPARVVSFDPSGPSANNQWVYVVASVSWNGTTWATGVPPKLTSDVRNIAEHGNTATNAAGLTLPIPGFELKAVPVGRIVVTFRDGDGTFFSAENVLDGQCPETP